METTKGHPRTSVLFGLGLGRENKIQSTNPKDPGLLAIYAGEPNSPKPQPTALTHSVLAAPLRALVNPKRTKRPKQLSLNPTHRTRRPAPPPPRTRGWRWVAARRPCGPAPAARTDCARSCHSRDTQHPSAFKVIDAGQYHVPQRPTGLFLYIPTRYRF
jgi:hypothetical protein